MISGRERIELGEHEGDFRLELTLERLSGRKGAYIRFAEADGEDGKTHCCWVVGGWQNSDSALESRTGGRNACLTQSNLYLKDSHPYRLTLELKGREMVTTVDGVEWNRVTEAPLRLRPLYLCASVEKATGDVILKAVNVQEAPVTAQIDCTFAEAEIETLCGAPEAENNFARPQALRPAVCRMGPQDGLDHTFPGHSVTVLRMKQG